MIVRVVSASHVEGALVVVPVMIPVPEAVQVAAQPTNPTTPAQHPLGANP